LKEYSYVLHDAADLTKTLEELKGILLPFVPEKILFSLYCASTKQAEIEIYWKGIKQEFLNAQIVGASTSGEISKDQIYEHTFVLTVLSFETSRVHVLGIAAIIRKRKLRNRFLTLCGHIQKERDWRF